MWMWYCAEAMLCVLSTSLMYLLCHQEDWCFWASLGVSWDHVSECWPMECGQKWRILLPAWPLNLLHDPPLVLFLNLFTTAKNLVEGSEVPGGHGGTDSHGTEQKDTESLNNRMEQTPLLIPAITPAYPQWAVMWTRNIPLSWYAMETWGLFVTAVSLIY